MRRDKKYAAWRFGLNAENWAKWFLLVKGYRILDRNYKTPVGEIDIIAKKYQTLCFIEVKGRSAAIEETPVSPRQMHRISRASLSFLQTRSDLAHLDMRYDVILVRPRQWPVHIQDIWRPG